ncbi:hypothetical protein [Planctellipticum variicoloris]|uniref:hypothetical protein n=1 Tax=Planctellipticum variicoloris TaxID=3064265 RepID=UPI003014147C|nr:hypothetical protein SH412_001348 [Planctomycetaceae bacterium SH412]
MWRAGLMCLGLTTCWLAGISPVAAQVMGHPADCCGRCRHPRIKCCCPAVQPVCAQPVVQTQLCPQPVVSYRDVTETHVRHEQYVEQVPVTTCRNVTVDEGGYQMVWVPKPVTKQVAQTVMSQQVKTRSVPYQVTRRVPTVSTAMVPVQSTAWVAPPASPCPPGTAISSYPQFGAISPTYAAPVSTTALPMMPAMSVPTPQSASLSTDFAFPAEPSGSQWQTITPRRSSEQPYEPSSGKPVPRPDDAASIPRKTSMFVPAPSAAMVWNSRHSSPIR